jgi:hypothetical protein
VNDKGRDITDISKVFEADDILWVLVDISEVVILKSPLSSQLLRIPDPLLSAISYEP